MNLSFDGKLICTGSWDKTAKIWDAKTGELLKTLEGHIDKVEYANFSPDAKFIITASWDQTAKIWEWEEEVKVMNSLNHSS